MVSSNNPTREDIPLHTPHMMPTTLGPDNIGVDYHVFCLWTFKHDFRQDPRCISFYDYPRAATRNRLLYSCWHLFQVEAYQETGIIKDLQNITRILPFN